MGVTGITSLHSLSYRWTTDRDTSYFNISATYLQGKAFPQPLIGLN